MSKITIFVVLIFTLACNSKKAENTAEQNGKPEIQFDTTYFSFGKISYGETVAYKYFFKNTGTGKLVIIKSDSGCGCTSLKFDKTEISAAEKCGVEVIFDSRGMSGYYEKQVKIYTNIKPEPYILSFEVVVEN